MGGGAIGGDGGSNKGGEGAIGGKWGGVNMGKC